MGQHFVWFSSGLRNDLKNITEQIEIALHSLHAQQREGLGLSDKISILDEFTQETVPFAKVGAVTEESPAAKAVNEITFCDLVVIHFLMFIFHSLQGLKSDDLVLAFGTLRIKNFTSLQDVARIVQHSVDKEVPLVVRRSSKLFPLTLTPRHWSGKGLLGCVLLPIDNPDRWFADWITNTNSISHFSCPSF